MWLLPVIAGGWFPPTGIDGTSARALWLETMGLVQIAIGVTYLIRGELMPRFAEWLASEPRPTAVLTQAPVPAEATNVVPFPDAAAGHGVAGRLMGRLLHLRAPRLLRAYAHRTAAPLVQLVESGRIDLRALERGGPDGLRERNVAGLMRDAA